MYPKTWNRIEENGTNKTGNPDKTWKEKKGFFSKQMMIGPNKWEKKTKYMYKYFMVMALNGFVDPVCSYLIET